MTRLPLAALALAAGLAAPAVGAPGLPQLSLPIACEPGRTCEVQHYVDRDPGPGTRDYRCGLQTYQAHDGTDIRLPDLAAQRRGVAVLAAAAGRVMGVRDGMADVSVRSAGAASVANRECGNGVVIDHGGGWQTQYCHMARGSIAVKSGDTVAAGTPLGRVGLSGNTEFPHLHFTVRYAGKAVDPFAPDMTNPGACAAQPELWTRAAQARMPYHAGAVLNAGFADRELTMEALEDGGLPAPTAGSPVLIAYVRAIALLPGDVVQLALRGPDGAVMAQTERPPLVRWRAQDLVFVGKRRPERGWAPGLYTADYRVLRQGKVAISRRVQLRL